MQAFETGRDPGTGGDSEKQFVLFSAMERLLGSGSGKQGRDLDFGVDAGRKAEAAQVEGDAVAQIDCGTGAQLFTQETAESETRLGVEVALVGFAGFLGKTKGGTSQQAGDKKKGP